jgi:transcription elongation factor B subunit 1
MDGDDDNLGSSTATPYIKLISAENSEIYLLRRIALQVETLRVMLEGSFRESEEGIIRFPDISTSALEKVVQYLHYKDRYSNSASRIPEFVIDPEEVNTHTTTRFMLY